MCDSGIMISMPRRMVLRINEITYSELLAYITFGSWLPTHSTHLLSVFNIPLIALGTVYQNSGKDRIKPIKLEYDMKNIKNHLKAHTHIRYKGSAIGWSRKCSWEVVSTWEVKGKKGCALWICGAKSFQAKGKCPWIGYVLHLFEDWE